MGISFETGVSYSPMGDAVARRRICLRLRRRGSETRFVFFEARVPRARGERRTRVVSALVTLAVPRRVRHRHGRVRERWSVRVREVSARSVPVALPKPAAQTPSAPFASQTETAEARDDAAHRLHVALSAALVAVDHDQVRVRTRSVRREANARAGALADGPVVERAPRGANTREKESSVLQCRHRLRPGRRPRARRRDARPRRGARAGGTGTSARGTKTRWRARRRKTRARPRRGFEGRVVRRARPRVQTRRARWCVVGERGATEAPVSARRRRATSPSRPRTASAMLSAHSMSNVGMVAASPRVRSGVVALPRFTTGRFFGRKKSLKKKKRYV